MPHLRGELVPGPVHLMQHQKEVPRSVEMVIQRPVCIALLSPINCYSIKSSVDKRREREKDRDRDWATFTSCCSCFWTFDTNRQ